MNVFIFHSSIYTTKTIFNSQGKRNITTIFQYASSLIVVIYKTNVFSIRCNYKNNSSLLNLTIKCQAAAFVC